MDRYLVVAHHQQTNGGEFQPSSRFYVVDTQRDGRTGAVVIAEALGERSAHFIAEALNSDRPAEQLAVAAS